MDFDLIEINFRRPVKDLLLDFGPVELGGDYTIKEIYNNICNFLYDNLCTESGFGNFSIKVNDPIFSILGMSKSSFDGKSDFVISVYCLEFLVARDKNLAENYILVKV